MPEIHCDECRAWKVELHEAKAEREILLARADKLREQLAARVRLLERTLADINDILGLCDQGRAGRVHDHMDMQAAACGERDGYGAWMDALQRMWQIRDPIGCFTIGPCLGTVRHARKRIASLLASNAKDQRACAPGDSNAH